MAVRTPPTSIPPVMHRHNSLRNPLGCWGLRVVLCLLVFNFCDLSFAARIPASAASSSSVSSSGLLFSEQKQSNIRKRNANFHKQIALIRNSSFSASIQQGSVVPQFVSVEHAIFQSAPVNENVSVKLEPKISNSTSPEMASSQNVGGEQIGQTLVDSNYLLNDITICGSEDCFETGMQITDSVPPTPTMRQQIADTLLMSGNSKSGREAIMHPKVEPIIVGKNTFGKRQFESADYWRSTAFDALSKKLMQRPLEAVAKNIIFFLGDGMSVPTVTAARILKGQQVDRKEFGEEGELHMDTFPYTGSSKTFCSDAQVADSACSATAYLCGVKANSGTIGLTPDVAKNNCSGQNQPAYRLSSILAWAQAAGKSTGVISTARVTHASPAGAYANIANRNWENDHEVLRDGQDPETCDDIAEQLVLQEPGRNINVILGGGRLQFLPRSKSDPETGRRGFRTDGKNLIEAWKQDKFNKNAYAYVEGREQLLQLDPSKVDFLLGLFAPSHMEYFHEQEKHDDPSLAEMTQVAIQILSKNPNGFFLFVEGARIDHAHHNNQGLRAIWETVEMDRALKTADEMTLDEETLILVTADHSHTFSLAGYPPRGNSISGIAEIALDNMPYTTLTYANGPAFKNFVNNTRYNISNDPFNDLKYKQIPNIPTKSETHAGDDVPIYASGPFAHLFTGVVQQNYLPHALAYASCIGPGPKYCDREFFK